MDHPDDELLAGAALAVDEDGRVQRRDARGEFEHILHGRTAGDELLRRGVTSDALAQQVQLALTFGHQSLAAIHVLQPPVHDVAQTLDFPTQTAALKVGAKRLELVAPALRVLANDGALCRALSQALAFAEIDLLSQAGARIAAGVSHQRPADGRAALAVVVRRAARPRTSRATALPRESGRIVGVMFQLNDLGAHDPFEPVQHDAGPQPFERIRPLRPVAQAHGVVVAIGVAKPQEQAPAVSKPERVDELLPQQPHGGGAEKDDALLVQTDDALIRPKIEELREMVGFQMGRLERRQMLRFHASLQVHSSG